MIKVIKKYTENPIEKVILELSPDEFKYLMFLIGGSVTGHGKAREINSEIYSKMSPYLNYDRLKDDMSRNCISLDYDSYTKMRSGYSFKD